MSAYRWRYLSSPGNYPATVRAARRRLTRLDSRTVKTWVPRTMDEIADMYYADTGKSVVLYFLANAGTWRGEKAREIKAELKEML